MLHILRIRIIATLNGNPFACDIVSDSLYARPDHAVLRYLLERPIADKTGDRVLPHIARVLLQRLIYSAVAARGVKGHVKRLALILRRAHGHRKRKSAPDLIDAVKGLKSSLRHHQV